MTIQEIDALTFDEYTRLLELFYQECEQKGIRYTSEEFRQWLLTR